ncbi:endo alpha-1,4 polygalactosaminidase [Nocardiopsis halophila]|uniref:endo alpha-1,4 polygalactosaminidase n=1 Tax=Nocardiopsis halophila TaxID=141692 RepID=UPI000362AD0F|nr:endo alpha-1,4 polygalactosaminidase [Nocardiopsis halophila]
MTKPSPSSRRAVRPLAACAFTVLLLAGCGGGAPEPEAGGGEDWWTPAPGEVASWEWQLEEPYDLSVDAQMYDLDLFEVAPAGAELHYPGGEVVEVPAGPLAGAVGELHAREPRPVVICYIDTGAYEHYRPDARMYPGYEEDLEDVPDRPAAPAEGSALGWSSGWEQERWLDIRVSERDAWTDVVWARFDLARELGCDGVEPDQNNPLGNDPGFPVTVEDQNSWYVELAEQAHARGLSVGMKNGHDRPGASAELAEHFDWALPEECVEFGECEALKPFIDQGKAVFAVDYRGGVDEEEACREYARLGFDGMVKDLHPNGAYRNPCSQG